MQFWGDVFDFLKLKWEGYLSSQSLSSKMILSLINHFQLYDLTRVFDNCVIIFAFWIPITPLFLSLAFNSIAAAMISSSMIYRVPPLN